MPLAFEWDEAKAYSNAAKHKVSFDEAKTVFNDPFLLTLFDEQHSGDEDRFLNSIAGSWSRVVSCWSSTPNEKIVFALSVAA